MYEPDVQPTPAEETEFAREVRLLAERQWAGRRPTTLVGRHRTIVDAQERARCFAETSAPVLITGETGVGKELFARAVYLKSTRAGRPYVVVNCAQYGNDHLIASELFGHKRGSFTGAVSDHRGVFEEANGGVVFLDEVGELPAGAQAMLLRTLGEGEVVPVGCTRAKPVDVRVIAATNRDLTRCVAEGRFREDLLFRLSFLQLPVAPVRERGSDWRLLLDFYLRSCNARSDAAKRFGDDAIDRLTHYPWPGNVREVRGLVEMSHCLCNGTGTIGCDLFEDRLQACSACSAPAGAARTRSSGAHGATGAIEGAPGTSSRNGADAAAEARLARIAAGEGTFWTLVHKPFMDRELNRSQVRAVVATGLRRSGWSYKRSLRTFRIEQDDYLKFMDFLRHHRLKPKR